MDARFHGSFPALITPFKDGKVDEAAFRKLIEWHISEGTHGIVPVGTTGESPTLSHDEHKRVVEIAVETNLGLLDHFTRITRLEMHVLTNPMPAFVYSP